ncbi:hypothetical protein LCGC14_0377220 [marine sediment metagenome]|uniref:Uncharacterized protein n=1 Tax=marine sediment metagenome TaxID=412755 RepID=A0A0F9VQW1_9ZZZZ
MDGKECKGCVVLIAENAKLKGELEQAHDQVQGLNNDIKSLEDAMARGK